MSKSRRWRWRADQTFRIRRLGVAATDANLRPQERVRADEQEFIILIRAHLGDVIRSELLRAAKCGTMAINQATDGFVASSTAFLIFSIDWNAGRRPAFSGRSSSNRTLPFKPFFLPTTKYEPKSARESEI